MMKHISILILKYFIIMSFVFFIPSFAGYWLMNWLMRLLLS